MSGKEPEDATGHAMSKRINDTMMLSRWKALLDEIITSFILYIVSYHSALITTLASSFSLTVKQSQSKRVDVPTSL